MSTQFIISRVATSNPQINGRTLYLSIIGLWTLNRDHARKFSKEAAEQYIAIANDSELRVEDV